MKIITDSFYTLFKSVFATIYCIIITLSPTLAQKSSTTITSPNPDRIEKVKPAIRKMPVGSDFKQVLVLTNSRYGPTVSPNGSGNQQEFKSNAKNVYSFEKEHNSAWYLFKAQYTGELTFDLVPEIATDDYDFLLYTYDSATFYKAFQSGTLKPVRSNLAHNDLSGKGYTGLSIKANSELVGPGAGDPYSKSLTVKKGDMFCLVLDNVHENGGGHTIYFHYPADVEIAGVVNTESKKGIKSDISIYDNKGDELLKTQTDESGRYGFHASLSKNENYTMVLSNDSSFDQVVTLSPVKMKNYKFTDITTVLPKLKGGKKYVLESINFHPGSEEMLAESNGIVYSLARLMKKNKGMIIRIEGHVNDPGILHRSKKEQAAHQGEDQMLSDMRAVTVYDFLANQGIEKTRMSTAGFAATKMLYPDAKSELEQMKNRRVEINVISVK